MKKHLDNSEKQNLMIKNNKQLNYINSFNQKPNKLKPNSNKKVNKINLKSINQNSHLSNSTVNKSIINSSYKNNNLKLNDINNLNDQILKLTNKIKSLDAKIDFQNKSKLNFQKTDLP